MTAMAVTACIDGHESGGVKVLTLHQPWASLISLGVKTIETRSWSTQYRGPLAIHAAARIPPGMEGLTGMVGQFSMHRDALSDGWYMLDRDWPGRHQGAPQLPIAIPLGAIVATCTLVDVVPMKAHTESTTDHLPHLTVGTRYDPDRLLLARPSTGFSTSFRVMTDHFEWATEIVTDQRPYGLFEPGRYAWLLADIVPVDPPVPFRGGQGLTKTWEP